MDKSQEQLVRQWIRNWGETGPLLGQLRAREIRNSDTAAAIEQLSDAFESARGEWSSPATSGLIEQQRLLARWRP